LPSDALTVAPATLAAQWLVARRVRYIDPERSFWRAEMSSAASATDAMDGALASFLHLPAQAVILEVAPAIREMVRALLISRHLAPAFPSLFTKEETAR